MGKGTVYLEVDPAARSEVTGSILSDVTVEEKRIVVGNEECQMGLVI